MSPFVRKVRTTSGATAVQIAVKEDGLRRIVEHLGSAHDETEVAALLKVGRQKIAARQGQGLLGLESLKASAWTNRPGGHHGGDHALGPAVGRSVRDVYLPGAGGCHWG